MEGPKKKVANVLLPSKHYIFFVQFQKYVTMRRSTLMLQEVFAMGTSSKGTKLHSSHMFPQP
jgi:hypothetical protein